MPKGRYLLLLGSPQGKQAARIPNMPSDVVPLDSQCAPPEAPTQKLAVRPRSGVMARRNTCQWVSASTSWAPQQISDTGRPSDPFHIGHSPPFASVALNLTRRAPVILFA